MTSRWSYLNNISALTPNAHEHGEEHSTLIIK